MGDVKRNISSSKYDTTYIRNEAVPTLEKTLVLADFITQPTNIPQGVGSTVRWIYDTNFATTNITNALTTPATNGPGDDLTYATRTGVHEVSFAGTAVEKQVDLYG